MAEKKFKSKTVKKYRLWKTAKYGLYAAKYAAPFIPATALTIINWDEWFNKSGVSLPLGFASLLATTLLALIGIMKRDEIVKKNVSVIFYLAIVFVCFGATCLFLANLMAQVGYLFMLTAAGLAASATSDQIGKTVVEERIAEYRELIDTNCLDNRAKRRQERKERARLEAEQEAAERQAVE